jgi:hypothetical protein
MVLLACNADGIDKLPPLVIGNSENPCCFKNIRKLTIKYVVKKAWFTQDIFAHYLRALDAKISFQDMKSLFFTGQCTVGLEGTSYLRNEKVVFSLKTAQAFSIHLTR